MTNAITDDPEPISAEFDAASREAWLKLVDKALKGGAFERQLVSHTADGFADRAPRHTRAMPSVATATKRGSVHGWDIRQRHAEPDPKLCNAAIQEDLEGA